MLGKGTFKRATENGTLPQSCVTLLQTSYYNIRLLIADTARGNTINYCYERRITYHHRLLMMHNLYLGLIPITFLTAVTGNQCECVNIRINRVCLSGPSHHHCYAMTSEGIVISASN